MVLSAALLSINTPSSSWVGQCARAGGVGADQVSLDAVARRAADNGRHHPGCPRIALAAAEVVPPIRLLSEPVWMSTPSIALANYPPVPAAFVPDQVTLHDVLIRVREVDAIVSVTRDQVTGAGAGAADGVFGCPCAQVKSVIGIARAAAVPARFVPILFPSTRVPVVPVPVIKTPQFAFAEIHIASPLPCRQSYFWSRRSG